MKKKVFVYLLLAFVYLPAEGRAQTTARDSVIEAQVHELAKVLRCPVCQGLSIADSPSELSTQMKNVVRDQLREGKSPDEVKAYFVSKYGEWILLEPKPRGMNWLVYLAPFFLLLAGGALIVHSVKKWTAPAAGSDSSHDEPELEESVN